MTAGRDLHDIHTTLHLVLFWDSMPQPTRLYTQHRLRLPYLAATRGWPAGIYYDTHGSDEFIPAQPGFWAGYQQPRPVTAQQARRSSRPATRRGRGRQRWDHHGSWHKQRRPITFIVIFFFILRHSYYIPGLPVVRGGGEEHYSLLYNYVIFSK
jgi:hypothetical protein